VTWAARHLAVSSSQAEGRDPDRGIDGPTDRVGLGASLEQFAGHPAYGTAQLRQDLDLFVFLPAGDDGEALSGPDAAG
jgi:hypothetical protein